MFDLPSTALRNWKWAVLSLAASAAWILLFILDPARHFSYLICPFHKLTGLLCPGCGSLRALHQLAHGNLAAAFRLNQLLMLALPFLVWVLLRQIARALTGKTLLPVSIRPWWGWPLLGMSVAFTILRNLP